MSRTLIASLLLSGSVLSASAMPAMPTSDASTQNPTLATYSAPRILSTTEFHVGAQNLPEGIPGNASMIVSLNVDADGHASNIHVVRSFSPEISYRVVEALSRSRFQPAVLNHQAISAPMTIQVAVQR